MVLIRHQFIKENILIIIQSIEFWFFSGAFGNIALIKFNLKNSKKKIPSRYRLIFEYTGFQ